MAPSYKLVYFNVTGLGEPIRYIFSYGKIPFEDQRVGIDEWPGTIKSGRWPPKDEAPFGKLPVLEVDGKKITQSHAICRFLAKRTGLEPKTEWDALRADELIETLTDLRIQYTTSYWERDPERKKELVKNTLEKESPFYFSKFDKIVGENNGTLIKDQLTWADLYFVGVVEYFENIIPGGGVDNYKNLKALVEKVNNLPGIKEYRANRPVTIF